MAKKIANLDVTNLWAPYMNNKLANCVNQYALHTITDSSIRDVYKKALRQSDDIIQITASLYGREQFPLPVGFTAEDIHLEAPPLFSDEFWLFYLYEMSIHGMSAYSLGLTTAIRQEIRAFYRTAFQGAMDLYDTTLALMETKGLLERCPTINLPETTEFAEKQSFLAGWFGDHRPLNAIEIASLYFNLKKSMMSKALVLGFSQTAQKEEVRKFMRRLIELIDRHTSLFDSILRKDDVSTSITWDTHVTDSKVPPFSDKLMMFHGSFLLQAAMAYYGTAFSSSMRRDLGMHYASAMASDAKLAEDGMNIMIANGWFEQPPHTVDRRDLVLK